jgi:hypothetical protein
MRSTLKALAGLCLLLLTSACLVETEATLGDADPKSFDTRLVGTWYSGKGSDAGFIAIVRDEKNEGGYRAVFVNADPMSDGDIEGARYEAARTVINGKPYLSIRRLGKASADMPALTIISYDFENDGTLVLRLMDTKEVIAAIEAGKLKGTFKRGQYVDEAKINSPRAELAAFIAAADHEKLFSQKFERMYKVPDAQK